MEAAAVPSSNPVLVTNEKLQHATATTKLQSSPAAGLPTCQVAAGMARHAILLLGE